MDFLRLFKPKYSVPDYYRDDEQFNMLYPPRIRRLAGRHWTPLKVARTASSFLGNEPGKTILDIGSGVGKFCLCAAQRVPDCRFTGIEQRLHLIRYAEKAKNKLGLTNVNFIHANITSIDFRAYDHFYFFNAFYEHLEPDVKIDRKIRHSIEFYEVYTHFLFQQLKQCRPGTKLCTYFGSIQQVPDSYRLVESHYDEKLKHWIQG